jgi:hypothetical protein
MRDLVARPTGPQGDGKKPRLFPRRRSNGAPAPQPGFILILTAGTHQLELCGSFLTASYGLKVKDFLENKGKSGCAMALKEWCRVQNLACD